MQLNRHVLFPAALLLGAFLLLCDAQPVSMNGPPSYYNEAEPEVDPEAVLELLARLERYLERAREATSKRGVDLGLGRGYSGSMTAKHLMGLASANFAGGPGRRRRSISLV